MKDYLLFQQQLSAFRLKHRGSVASPAGSAKARPLFSGQTSEDETIGTGVLRKPAFALYV